MSLVYSNEIEESRRRVAPVDAVATLAVRREDATWDGALDAFARLLADVEARLAAGDWDDAAEHLAGEVTPPDLREAPSPEQVAIGQRLLARAEEVTAELAQAMSETRRELEVLGRRRVAAAGYLASDGAHESGAAH